MHHRNVIYSLPKLSDVHLPSLDTATAAAYLNRQPQTLRVWACLENGPLRPIRIHGRLAWPTDEVRRLLHIDCREPVLQKRQAALTTMEGSNNNPAPQLESTSVPPQRSSALFGRTQPGNPQSDISVHQSPISARKLQNKNMTKIWSLQELRGPAMHVLHHWQAFQVRPTDICFLPLPGPHFAVFVGLIGYNGLPDRTTKIVAFDPANRMLQTKTGETYCLGPDSGFTTDMQQWYRKQLTLPVAVVRDVTHEVLCLLAESTRIDDTPHNLRFTNLK